MIDLVGRRDASRQHTHPASLNTRPGITHLAQAALRAVPGSQQLLQVVHPLAQAGNCLHR